MGRGEVLRVPLNRDEEAPLGIFKTFDDAVLGPGDDAERADPAGNGPFPGGLVMAAIDLEPIPAGDRGEPTGRIEIDDMRQPIFRFHYDMPDLRIGPLGRQILDQRLTNGRGHELEASANPQEGEIGRQPDPGESELAGIELGVDIPARSVLGPVPSRIDVRSAREQDPSIRMQELPHRVQGRPFGRIRKIELGIPARAADGFKIGAIISPAIGCPGDEDLRVAHGDHRISFTGTGRPSGPTAT